MEYNPYIPWNVDMFYDAVAAFRSNLGSIFNIGLWIFFILAGVFLIVFIVQKFTN